MKLYPFTSLSSGHFLVLLLCASLNFQSSAQANSSAPESSKPDEEQPVEVIANSLDAAEKLGRSIYQGAVIITQGSTQITGEQVRIQHPLSILEMAIATGNPATFKRYSIEQQKWFSGYAEEITYNAKLKTLLFKGNAKVEQEGQNAIQGPEIFYDLTQKTLSAKGSSEPNQRIKVTFTPEKSPETTVNAKTPPQKGQP